MTKWHDNNFLKQLQNISNWYRYLIGQPIRRRVSIGKLALAKTSFASSDSKIGFVIRLNLCLGSWIRRSNSFAHFKRPAVGGWFLWSGGSSFWLSKIALASSNSVENWSTKIAYFESNSSYIRDSRTVPHRRVQRIDKMDGLREWKV